MPDARVENRPTESKSLDPGATDGTVNWALQRAKGQAADIAVDARGSGLDQSSAQHGIRRFLGTPHAHKVDAIRLVGDDYDLKWNRER